MRRDHGLSATESIEYELWLAADPRHRTAMARTGDAWVRLDRLPENLAQRVLEQSRRRRRGWRIAAGAGSLAAAAAIALLFFSGGDVQSGQLPPPADGSPTALQAAGPRLVALADGTEVRLNAGSEIVERFSAAERGVELTRGEAHFTVTKDPARPFVVTAGGLRVRAVGTAFNVSRAEARTEVLVTEGRVALLTEDGGQRPEIAAARAASAGRTEALVSPRRLITELGAGERAVVTLPTPGAEASPEVAVARVDQSEMARALAWQENLLRLGGATLAEIAAEFERRTGHRVVLADPALGQVRLGGRFRADDAEGFAKLLTSMLDVDVERAADGTIVLRKKK